MEVIDNKKYYIPDDKIISSAYRKVKYKDTVGYVSERSLSENNDIPFIDNRKYELPEDEFDYDKMNAIKALKKLMFNRKYYKDKISYYYIDDPQMFSLYGIDCDSLKIKIIAIILNSKVVSYYSRLICFEVKNNKFIPYYDLQIEVEDKIVIEENIKYYIRNRPSDCDAD